MGIKRIMLILLFIILSPSFFVQEAPAPIIKWNIGLDKNQEKEFGKLEKEFNKWVAKNENNLNDNSDLPIYNQINENKTQEIKELREKQQRSIKHLKNEFSYFRTHILGTKKIKKRVDWLKDDFDSLKQLNKQEINLIKETKREYNEMVSQKRTPSQRKAFDAMKKESGHLNGPNKEFLTADAQRIIAPPNLEQGDLAAGVVKTQPITEAPPDQTDETEFTPRDLTTANTMNFVGPWSGNFSGTISNCANPAENGPENGTISFNINQIGNTVSATWKDRLGDNVLAGTISGNTLTATINTTAPDLTKEQTAVNGTISGNTITGTYSGNETSPGDICTWEGTFTITK